MLTTANTKCHAILGHTAIDNRLNNSDYRVAEVHCPTCDLFFSLKT